MTDGRARERAVSVPSERKSCPEKFDECLKDEYCLSCSSCWSCANAVRGREEVTAEFRCGLRPAGQGFGGCRHTGCFVVGGERYGYFCELMEAYAENGGRELDFTAGVSSARMWNNLRSGLTDVGVAVSSDVEAGALSLPVRTTTYVMLAGRERPCGGTGLSGTVGSGRVVMPEGFTRTASYTGLLDSLAGAQLYISPLNVYELAAGLARGESDFLICEQGEAAVVGEFVPGLATSMNLRNGWTLAWSFRPKILPCITISYVGSADTAGRRSMPRCAMSTPAGEMAGVSAVRRVTACAERHLGMGRHDTGGRYAGGGGLAPAVGYRLQGVAFPA